MTETQKKTIYLVRHGQSIDNASPVIQSKDSPLNKRGIEQAERIAERLSSVQFEILVASPLPRADETAQYIAKRTSKPVILSGLFVERIKPSEIDGRPWTDEAASRAFHAWERTLFTPGLRFSDGENYDDITTRADEALRFLETRKEQTITVITHGFFLKAIVARVLFGNSLTPDILRRLHEHAKIENTAITTLQLTSVAKSEVVWNLLTLNDHSHYS